MSNENGENRGGELPDEQADALLDQLAARADERDDIDLRPGSKRTISRRSLLGAVGAAGAGALALGSGNAEAQTGQWGNATGSAGTESKPFSEAWVQDLYSESGDFGSVSTGHVWLGQQADTPTDSEIGSGNVALYAKDDGNVYKKPYDGSESQVGGSGGDGAFTDDDGDNIYTLPNASDGIGIGELSGSLVNRTPPVTNLSGDIYVTASGAEDPTSDDGDIWIEV